MAIYPKPAAYAPPQPPASTPTQPINIEAWTEQTKQSLSTLSLTPASVRGTSAPLAIDLDDYPPQQVQAEPRPSYLPRREPLRRDSLARREALLKGKEGSRRRTRWENGSCHTVASPILCGPPLTLHVVDRLLNNPWATPPLPSDFQVQPTHCVRNVPYYLVPLWDQGVAARAEKKKAEQKAKREEGKEDEAGRVPKELREELKKAKAARGLLRDLEEQVRLFVKRWENAKKEEEELDSEDEEIVFVGRNGVIQDRPPSSAEEMERERLVFDSLAEDQGASFGYSLPFPFAECGQRTLKSCRRWLVHSIASYYGLRTWSITVGDPARREAYVGIPSQHSESRFALPGLPRPLWGMV